MAKNDYHVIVYQILSYLYQCLKSGIDVEKEKLQPGSRIININEKYWEYIIFNIIDMGLVNGTSCRKTYDGHYTIVGLDEMMITPKGIEYLCDNSFLAKAKEFVQGTADVLSPFF